MLPGRTGLREAVIRFTEDSRGTRTCCTGSLWTTSWTAWIISWWWDPRNRGIRAVSLCSRPPPSIRIRSTDWALVSISWSRVTRCGGGARTWSNMFSREEARWEVHSRYDWEQRVNHFNPAQIPLSNDLQPLGARDYSNEMKALGVNLDMLKQRATYVIGAYSHSLSNGPESFAPAVCWKYFNP